MVRHSDDGPIKGNTSTLVLYAIVYAFILGVVGATQSRMGLFATASGSAIVLMCAVARYSKRISALVLLLPLTLAGAGGVLALNGQGLFERLGDLGEASGTRGDLYRQVWELIMMRPWTGFGGGSFELAFPLVHRLPVSSDYIWDKGHNTFLTLWAELGLVAGSLPIVLFAAIAVTLVLALKRRRGDWVAQTIGLAVLVLSVIHSLVDFSLEIQANTFVFLALIAAAMSTSVRLSRPSAR